MSHRFMSTASLATVALLLVSGPTLAESQLRQQVADQLAAHQIDVPNYSSLSDSQINRLALILSNADANCCQEAQIKSLLATKTPCEGNAQLYQQVANQLKEHRITVQNLDKVSGSELVVVKSILDGSGSDADKRARITTLFAEDQSIVGDAYLRDDAQQCVKMVGADVDLTAMSPDELLQIQLIANSTDSANTKRSRIQQLAK